MDAPISSPLTSSTMTTQQTSPTTMTSKIIPPQPAQIKAPSTDAFLKDFTLVAEAAKRAQMAVLMRDLESVGLS
ncbi:hypothetical protein QBC46DRAFT_370159 [Diplogelasinospora grovesii]|uniref:Uncharacterized protein n=1 Tax=Diplogelasinospora grovesii TaxID=303347 RepID=A0AAN6S9B7_9PEZI|nr:hypothetical protein QBC46DRAFT_370159 [Diplogelasinospora grovesii]